MLAHASWPLELSSSYVFKFMKFVILNWIQALEVLQRKSVVSNLAAYLEL